MPPGENHKNRNGNRTLVLRLPFRSDAVPCKRAISRLSNQQNDKPIIFSSKTAWCSTNLKHVAVIGFEQPINHECQNYQDSAEESVWRGSQKKKRNGHIRHPLTLWNAFVNLQLPVLGGPQSVFGWGRQREEHHYQRETVPQNIKKYVRKSNMQPKVQQILTKIANSITIRSTNVC